jgi:hypothetical protein
MGGEKKRKTKNEKRKLESLLSSLFVLLSSFFVLLSSLFSLSPSTPPSSQPLALALSESTGFDGS